MIDHDPLWDLSDDLRAVALGTTGKPRRGKTQAQSAVERECPNLRAQQEKQNARLKALFLRHGHVKD